ncbi:hypothetical protein VUR80DRAFT_2266 [Thermomyces stellatus]
MGAQQNLEEPWTFLLPIIQALAVTELAHDERHCNFPSVPLFAWRCIGSCGRIVRTLTGPHRAIIELPLSERDKQRAAEEASWHPGQTSQATAARVLKAANGHSSPERSAVETGTRANVSGEITTTSDVIAWAFPGLGDSSLPRAALASDAMEAGSLRWRTSSVIAQSVSMISRARLRQCVSQASENPYAGHRWFNSSL